MTFDIITLGCKVNEYESQFYKEQMEKLHLQPKTDHTPADVVIINTCTVTNTAASKSRQKIRKARKENPDAILAVVGCYAQTMEEEIRRDLQADLLIGAAHKNEIALQVAKLLEKKKADVALERIENIVDFESMPIGAFEGQHRAFLKIQDGCNQYCAYCQIPLARGPERSQMPSQVVEIAKSLADKGHLEIVLTGIHTGRYSFRKENLAQLLKELLEATNENVCFRISSIEITEVSDELLDLMASNPRILPHLHIPIQSGCNATLHRMKRPYTIEQFKERADYIRSKVPNVSISTDIICGFPQESDEEFEQTIQNLDDISFSFLHVFPYSRRKGTVADEMEGHVHPQTAKQRASRLLQLSDELRKRDMARFDEVEVLVEREDPHHPGIYTGYTKQYHPARIKSLHPLEGRILLDHPEIEDTAYLYEMTGK